MKKRNLIPGFLSLILLMMACFLSLRDGLLMDWWSLGSLVSVSILVSLFVTVTYYNRVTTVAGILTGLAAEGVLVLFFHEQLYLEWLQCYHHVIPIINSYYRTGFPYEEIVPVGGWLLLLCAGILLGLWMGPGVARGGKKRLLTLIPVAVCFLSGFLLGYAPGMGAFLCLIGGLGMGLWTERKGEDPAERKSRRLVFLCLCAATGITALIYRPISRNALAHHDAWKEWQLAQEDRMLAWIDGNSFLTDLFWSFGGYSQYARLSNQPPGLGDREILTVTMDQRPDEPIYIKNFTGAYYDNGVWYPASEQEFDDLAQEQGIRPEEYGAFVQTMSHYGNQSQPMTIEILRKTGNTTPMPYGSGLPEGAEIVGDSGIRLPDERIYQFDWHPDRYIYNALISSFWPGSDFSDTEWEMYDTYQNYAGRQYTTLPENQLFRLRENLEEAQYILSGDILSYSFDLEPVSEGQDIIEYFIFEQQKGYCMHFASAYTLAYRMMGQPARYASGYLVLPRDFERNEDGTYTAVVREERAHAWTEIFRGPFGWTYLEVTPPSYYYALLEQGDQESVSDIVESIQPEEPESPVEPDIPEEPEEQEPEPLPQPEEPEETLEETPQEPEGGSGPGTGDGGLSARVWPILSAILYPVFILTALWLMILLRIKLLHRRRERSFRDPDSRKAARALFRETLRLLRLSGIVFHGTENEEAFAREVEEAVPYFAQDEFVKFIGIVRAARYGREPLAEGEIQYLRMIYRKARQQEMGRGKWYRKLYVRYVLAL